MTYGLLPALPNPTYDTSLSQIQRRKKLMPLLFTHLLTPSRQAQRPTIRTCQRFGRRLLAGWLVVAFLLLAPSHYAQAHTVVPLRQNDLPQTILLPLIQTDLVQTQGNGDASPALAAAGYGAATIVGEPLEACETEQTRPTARILTTAAAWQTALQNAAPGTVFLLRGGLYQASQSVRIGAGLAGQPVTVKPYNCEAVTLRGGLQLQSYTLLAGLRIESALATQTGPSYALRIDGKTTVRRGITIRHNTIVGGEIDAIRLNDQVSDVTITGNRIDGGKGGHDLFVTTETTPVVTAKSPTNIVISNNRFTKVYYRASGIASEDMFQVRDAQVIQFLANTCENGSRMEQCVDIKNVSAPLTIQGNLFNGATLQQDGPGEDRSSGCMVIHEFDGRPEAHLIERNYFRHCRTTIIRFASEGGLANSSGIVRYNVFLNAGSTDDEALLLWRSENVRFENNTMIRGVLKLGRGNGLAQNPPITPKNTTFKNNLFYQSRLDDNTRVPDFTYQCGFGLFFQLSQRGNRTFQCATSLTTDPRLTLLSAEDYRPAANSLACTSGENRTTIGAQPCQPAVQSANSTAASEAVVWYDAVTNPGLVEPSARNADAGYDPLPDDETIRHEVASAPFTDDGVANEEAIAIEVVTPALIYHIFLPVATR